MSYRMLNTFLLAYGTRLLPMKKLPTEIRLTRIISGLVMRMSDMPADFMASNS